MDTDKIHERAEYVISTSWELWHLTAGMRRLAEAAQHDAYMHSTAETNEALERRQGRQVSTPAKDKRAYYERDLQDTMTAARNQLKEIQQFVIRLENDLGGLEQVIL